MRLSYATALVIGTLMSGAAVPALAQTAPETRPADAAPATPAPSATPAAPSVVIVAPEGYSVYDFASVTADELKGLDLYDAEGNSIAEISDLEIGTDNAITRMIVDVGGFLGMGVHTVALTPEQVSVYRNADGDLRGYVTLDKAALEALPAYEAPAN